MNVGLLRPPSQDARLEAFAALRAQAVRLVRWLPRAWCMFCQSFLFMFAQPAIYRYITFFRSHFGASDTDQASWSTEIAFLWFRPDLSCPSMEQFIVAYSANSGGFLSVKCDEGEGQGSRVLRLEDECRIFADTPACGGG